MVIHPGQDLSQGEIVSKVLGLDYSFLRLWGGRRLNTKDTKKHDEKTFLRWEEENTLNTKEHKGYEGKKNSHHEVHEGTPRKGKTFPGMRRLPLWRQPGHPPGAGACGGQVKRASGQARKRELPFFLGGRERLSQTTGNKKRDTARAGFGNLAWPLLVLSGRN